MRIPGLQNRVIWGTRPPYIQTRSPPSCGGLSWLGVSGRYRLPRLLRRLRCEDLPPGRLGFRFGLRCFLGFFATFVFASHVW